VADHLICVLTFGIAVGIAYYGGLSPSEVTLGLSFRILFRFRVGVDDMLIPLMDRATLPTDTIGQARFPYLIARLSEGAASYPPLQIAFLLSFPGALLPGPGQDVAMAPDQDLKSVAAH
jgi:hypothetical protein